MKIFNSSVIFFSIILIIGGLTVITDLKLKKIYNNHLVIGAVLGLAAIIYTDFWAHENILFHIINGLIAFVAGFCFYRFGLWRGGDAKLFTLYAFLMPELERVHLLLPSAINLFACSFITGLIIILPFIIKNIALNYKTLINKLLTTKKHKTLFLSIGITVWIFWVLSSFYLIFANYYSVKIIPNPAISLAVIYLFFNLARWSLVKMKKNYTIVGIGIAIGFLLRLWLSPNSLSWPILTYFILKTGLYSGLSACIYSILDNLKEHQDRVPFAPLLFMGCVLSYTPFLAWVMHLITR